MRTYSKQLGPQKDRTYRSSPLSCNAVILLQQNQLHRDRSEKFTTTPPLLFTVHTWAIVHSAFVSMSNPQIRSLSQHVACSGDSNTAYSTAQTITDHVPSQRKVFGCVPHSKDLQALHKHVTCTNMFLC